MKTKLFAVVLSCVLLSAHTAAVYASFGNAFGTPNLTSQYGIEPEIPEIKMPIRAPGFNAELNHAPGYGGPGTSGKAGYDEGGIGTYNPLDEWNEIRQGLQTPGGAGTPGGTQPPGGAGTSGGAAPSGGIPSFADADTAERIPAFSTASSPVQLSQSSQSLPPVDIPASSAPDSTPAPAPITPTPTPVAAAQQEAARVTLTQNYDIKLGLYEQIFETGRSFLATVPNGGSTADGVYVDFPTNMRVAVEHNGTVISYASRQTLTATGPYVFTITSPGLVSGTQNIGVFTFRILPPHASGKENAGIDGEERPQLREYFAVSSNGGKDLIDYVFSNHRRFYANVADGEELQGPVYFVFPPNVTFSLDYRGKRVPYTSNQLLAEPGAYTMHVTAYATQPTGIRSIWYTAAVNFTILPPPAPESPLGGFTGGDFAGGLPGDSFAGDTSGAAAVVREILAEVPEGEGYRMVFSNGDSFTSSAANDDVIVAAEAALTFPSGMAYDLYEWVSDGGGSPILLQSGVGPNSVTLTDEGGYQLRVRSQLAYPALEAELLFFLAHDDETAAFMRDLRSGAAQGGAPVDAPGAAEGLLDYTSLFRDVYATVVTNARAIFDFPLNVEWDILKDNRPIVYQSGDEITEAGVYTISVAGPEGGLTGMSFTLDGSLHDAGRPGTVYQQGVAESMPTDGAAAAGEGFGALMPPTRNLPEQTWGDSEYYQNLSDEVYFTSSVPNRMLGIEPVVFSIPAFLTRTLVFNGEQIDFAGDEVLSAPGSYLLTVLNPINGTEFDFAFVILPEFNNLYGYYTPPVGYTMGTTDFVSEELTYSEYRSDIRADGFYAINLVSDVYPSLLVSFTVDTVAPELTIEGLDENGRMIGDVKLVSDDPEATIHVSVDGQPTGYQSGGILTKNGSYAVTIADRAGNHNVYEFVIPYRMNRTAILFIVLVVLLIGGGAYYFLKIHRNLKV